MAMSRNICKLYTLGMVPYQQAWEMQKSLVELQKQGIQGDSLLLLEHPEVYTLGQGAEERFLKFNVSNSPYPVFRVERGGEVTFHCPGQVVCYPILNLSNYRKDLHWYLRQLEEVVIRCLSVFSLQGERISGLTGVWVDDYKVAAIGIKVSRWITMHGLALNVYPDMVGFQHIVPCGIHHKLVGCLQQFCPNIQLEDVQRELIIAFAEIFNIEFQPLADWVSPKSN